MSEHAKTEDTTGVPVLEYGAQSAIDLLKLRRSRGGHKSKVTKTINEIKVLLNKKEEIDHKKIHDKTEVCKAAYKSFLEAHKIYQDALVDGEDEEEVIDSNSYIKVVENNVRLINDEIKTWLDSHSVNTKVNADVPRSSTSKKGKSRSRHSKLSDAQVQVVAARAALEAKAANLRQQQDIDKELLKLTQAKTQLEMNTKLAVLKAKEDVYLDNNSSTSSQSTHSNLPAARRKEIVQWVTQVENSLDKPKDTAKVPQETDIGTLHQKRQEGNLNQNKQDSNLNPQAAA